MSVDGRTQATTGVCLISLIRGPCRVGRTSPDEGWSCVVASTLNGASKRSISCMASNTIIHSLRMRKSFGGAISYIWCMLIVYKSNKIKLNPYKNKINLNKKKNMKSTNSSWKDPVRVRNRIVMEQYHTMYGS